MSGAIQTIDLKGNKQTFQHPEQLKGRNFKKVYITKNDWTAEAIRLYIRPSLTAYGGELVEW